MDKQEVIFVLDEGDPKLVEAMHEYAMKKWGLTQEDIDNFDEDAYYNS